MAETRLSQSFREATDKAVNKAVHTADPVRFHDRLPPGQCPFCMTAMQQMQAVLSDSIKLPEGMREDLEAIVTGMSDAEAG